MPCEHEDGHRQAKERGLERYPVTVLGKKQPSNALSLESWHPELRDMTFLLSQSSGVWYLIVPALANQSSIHRAKWIYFLSKKNTWLPNNLAYFKGFFHSSYQVGLFCYFISQDHGSEWTFWTLVCLIFQGWHLDGSLAVTRDWASLRRWWLCNHLLLVGYLRFLGLSCLLRKGNVWLRWFLISLIVLRYCNNVISSCIWGQRNITKWKKLSH